MSPSVEGLFGATAAEVVADADVIRSRVHPDDAERVRRVQQACGAAGRVVSWTIGSSAGTIWFGLCGI